MKTLQGTHIKKSLDGKATQGSISTKMGNVDGKWTASQPTGKK
jgi:hypothetical protein